MAVDARYIPPAEETMAQPSRGRQPPYTLRNQGPDEVSAPSTPASFLDSKSDDNIFRSGSSTASPQLREFDYTSSNDPRDTTSSHTSAISTLSTKNLPSPHLPLRKRSQNRLKLHLSPKNDRSFSSGSESSAALHSPTLGYHSTIASPLLSAERAGYTPSSPLAATTPNLSPRNENVHNDRQSDVYVPASVAWSRARGMTTSSTGPGFSPGPQLKSSNSIPDLSSFKTTQRSMVSSTYKPDRGPNAGEAHMSYRKDLPAVPWKEGDEIRSSFRSFRSNWTTASGFTNASSAFADEGENERSSIVTTASSFEMVPKPQDAPREDDVMSVEDAIGMYADFDDDGELEKRLDAGIEEVKAYMEGRDVITKRPASPEFSPEATTQSNQGLERPNLQLDSSVLELSSKSPAVSPLSHESSNSDHEHRPPVSPTQQSPPREEFPDLSPPTQPLDSPLRYHPMPTRSTPPPMVKVEKLMPVPRDRYGFKKATNYITVEQYDEWNVGYTEYLQRRQTKWDTLMKQYGLSTENPIRFPPKSDKVKRFVRKGIPPHWRGAAWFWYAGGPDMLAREPGLYRQLIKQVEEGHLSETDRDIIERDLNRTFPDNIKFKPDPVPEHESFPGKAVRPPRVDSVREERILGSLRRVLQAFAVHNFNIGYCQSLNFLAGLLLLFLDEDEEKAFILLNIITNTHLPGTHAKILEANVDIGVLMSCIRESMPAVWAKIDDSHEQPVRGRRGHPVSATRLPTVSLATTSWFMSCFVGNLPTESVLRVWDSLFYEGSKTLFRISLAIFKSGEQDIRTTGEQLEIFQVVQSIPRRLIDVNALMESCFKRRNGFGHLSQETIDIRRRERRGLVREERAMRERERGRTIQRPPGADSSALSNLSPGSRANTNMSGLSATPSSSRPPTAGSGSPVEGKQSALKRAASKARQVREKSRTRKRERERATNAWSDAQWRDAN